MAARVPQAALADPTTFAAQPAPSGYCASTNAFAYLDGLDGVSSACALPPGTFDFSAVYLQNASRVGGTALAAYPLVSVRAGIFKRVQFSFDPPSAIAQSHPGGGGSFPVTNPGYGLTYTLAQSDRGAAALVTDVLPPDSRFTPAHAQSRYLVGLDGNLAFGAKWSLGGALSATSSQRSGFNTVLPALVASAGYTSNGTTQFTTAIGERLVTRHSVSQAYGDAAVNQVLAKKLVMTVGVGTTFNAVNDSKAHYLSGGFNYRP